MSRKPESGFIARVHNHLQKSVWREKMYNPYRSGTPDVWYSGKVNDLWVEYKYIPRLPKKTTTIIPINLSALQEQWIKNRSEEGRNVWVIVGCPQGGSVYSYPFNLTPTCEMFVHNLAKAKDVAERIAKFVDEGVSL